MKKSIIKKFIFVCLTILMCIPNCVLAQDEEVHKINLESTLNQDGTYSFLASVDGESINEYDYTWNIDLQNAHSDVKNSPSEYYTGTAPSEDESIYVAHDIYYYPELDENKFVKGVYGDETEWLYYYELEGYEDYIFATLPVEGNSVPTRMMHSSSEAYNNAVLHINEAGTYQISGNWHGQIYVDLGEDSFDDPSQVVTLILDNVDIECSVASGIVFYQVYEVDNTWEEREIALTSYDTSLAGANIIIADDSTNNVSGANIYRILKTKYKDEDSTATIKEQKKSKKVDGALYSYMSMNIDGQEKGNGVLNINSEFEGLDTELHLTINGGNINIVSDNDGINVNEDYVSIFTMNGGTLQILAGTGYEGDGIDSNGYLNINGGYIISSAKPQSDSGLDSDSGTYINGGFVVAFGSSMDLVNEYSEDSQQVTANLIFASSQSITNPIIVVDEKEKAVIGFDLSDNEFFKDANRSYQCLVISSDKLKVDSDYYIYTGGSIKGDNTNGLYDSIKSYEYDNVLSYSSTSYNGIGGMGGNRNMPSNNNDVFTGNFEEKGNENFNGNNMPEGMENPDENFDPSKMPTDVENNEGMQKPDDNFSPNQNQGEMKQGEMPADMNQGEMPTDLGQQESSEASTIFTMQDKVNTFANVTKATLVEKESSVNIYLVAGLCVAGGLIIGIVTMLIINKAKAKKVQA